MKEEPIAIEEDEEEPVLADSWASFSPVADRERDSAFLAAEVDKFKQAGGKVQEIPMGLSSEWKGSFTFPQSNKGTKERQAIHDKLMAGQRAKHQLADAKFVAKLSPMLGVATSIVELAKSMGCSDDKLQRVLRQYFADDARAHPYRRKCHEQWMIELEAEGVARIEEALSRGIQGAYKIGDSIGMSPYKVSALNNKYKLGVKRLRGGHVSREQQKEAIE